MIRIAKPKILSSIPLDRHAVIEASAGTGKTYTLEHLVIEILLTGDVTLDRLLVVTFTEKAAAELRARLRRKMTSLLEATLGDDDAELAWTLDDMTRRKLARALLSFDAASIQTIHGFCQRVLQENAFQSGRLFDQELVDGLATFERAFYDVLRTDIAHRDDERVFLDAWLASHRLQDLVTLLWEAHTRRGIFHPRLDVPKLEAMLRVLSKMELTPHALRPALVRAEMHPATIHATLERVASMRRTLTEYIQDGDLPTALVALQGLPQAVSQKLEPVVTEEGKLHELLIALREVSDSIVGFESAVCQRFLPLVQARLKQTKAKRGQLDFDDMLALLHDSLDGPAGPALAESLRARYAFALIDEFQDTDEVQWAIFSKVFIEGPDESSRLFVIGDPKQAIYGFRGADVHTYLGARQRIAETGGTTVHLTESFRATGRMIEAQNLILDDEADAPLFTGAIRYDHPVTCGAPERIGLTRDGHLLAPIHLSSLVPRDDTFQRTVHARQALADHYAKEIVTLLDQSRTKFVTDEETPIDADDIFVLTRSTKEGLEVAEALRRYGVPYAFFKQDGLFQTQEAHDVRDLLAAIADPLHQSRRLRAWRSPFFAVPIESLPNLRDVAGSHRLMRLLFDWKALADEKRFERLYSSILTETGLIERELFLSASERELTNYLHIFEVLLEEMLHSRATLPELVHTLGAFIQGRRSPPGEDGNVQRVESENKAVKLMTMHKAKGLEAPVVFLYGGFDEPFGRVVVHHDDGRRLLHVGRPRPDGVREEADEENQRLLYVAMTRAKARLYVPYLGTKPSAADGTEVRVLKRLVGSHAQLNDRLDHLLDGGYDASLFEVTEVAELDRRRNAPTHRDESAARLDGWNPPPELMRPIVTPPKFERLREEHLGFDVTSYSRIKAEKGGYKPPEGILEDDIAFDIDGIPSSEDALGSGPAIGRFLHEMLELVPLESAANAASLSFFGANTEVKAIFVDGMHRYGIDLRHLEEAIELVYKSLVGPITLGNQRTLAGVVSADRVVREMEFLYPFDEGDRSFVKGFIDVTIEHEGRVYVLDWKSDLLPNYDPRTIDRHVEQNYRLQAQLYALAIVKLFAMNDEDSFERHFGGAIYCFLRGMTLDGDGTNGVFFDRPSFDDIRRYTEELKR